MDGGGDAGADGNGNAGTGGDAGADRGAKTGPGSGAGTHRAGDEDGRASAPAGTDRPLARSTGNGGTDRTNTAPAGAARRRGPVVAAMMLGMALAALDGTVVATAVPQIVGDLGGFSVFSWLFSGYLLAVTVTLPVYGKLSDTFGRKPVLIVGIVLFLAGSLLCAAAWNMASLIAFRVVRDSAEEHCRARSRRSPPICTR